MSTQYSVVNTRITEEVAEFQKKVSAIRAECLRMMREASVSADLQEIKEDLIDKLSDRALFSVEEPEGTFIVIGTARAGHFSWRTENGFHDLDSVMRWLQSHPDYTICDEWASAAENPIPDSPHWCKHTAASGKQTENRLPQKKF